MNFKIRQNLHIKNLRLQKLLVSIASLFVITLMITLTQGCKIDDVNVLKDRSKDYGNVQVYPELSLPRDAQTDKSSDLYEIP